MVGIGDRDEFESPPPNGELVCDHAAPPVADYSAAESVRLAEVIRYVGEDGFEVNGPGSLGLRHQGLQPRVVRVAGFQLRKYPSHKDLGNTWV